MTSGQRVWLILVSGLAFWGCRSELSLERCQADGSCGQGYVCEYEWHGRHYCVLSRDASASDLSLVEPDAEDGVKVPRDSGSPDARPLDLDMGPVDGDLVDSGPMDAAPKADACMVSEEVCNGLDDDCDGVPDNIADQVGCIVGAGNNVCPEATLSCVDGQSICTPPDIRDGCNSTLGMDDDCDGYFDEDIDETLPEGVVREGLPAPGDSCTRRVEECQTAGEWSCEAGGAGELDRWVCTAAIIESTAERCNGNDENCNGVVDDRCTCSDVEIIRSNRISACRDEPDRPIEVRTDDSYDALGASCHTEDPIEEVSGLVRAGRNDDNGTFREKVFHLFPPTPGTYVIRLNDRDAVANDPDSRRDPVLALRTTCEQPGSEIACDDDNGPGKDSIITVPLDEAAVRVGIYIIAQGWFPGRDEQPMDLFIRRLARDCEMDAAP